MSLFPKYCSQSAIPNCYESIQHDKIWVLKLPLNFRLFIKLCKGFKTKKRPKKAACCLQKNNLSQEDVTLLVYCKNWLAVWTAETACFCCLKAAWTNRTVKNLGENGIFYGSSSPKEVNCIVQRFLNVKELAKAKQLEDFIDFWLNVQKDNVSALWFYKLKEGCKRANAGWGNII